MRASEVLKDNLEQILGEWSDLMANDYPRDTARFLKGQHDRFANPVGHSIVEAASSVLTYLSTGQGIQKAHAALDGIIRIRAVQDFTAPESIRFIFRLKDVLRPHLKAAGCDPEELRGLDEKIDELALDCFEIYMQCREKIYEIKASEVQSSTYRLLERAKILCPAEDGEESP